jgi:hypothetical protein
MAPRTNGQPAYHIRVAKGSVRVAAHNERSSTRDRRLGERRPTRRARADVVTPTTATVFMLRAHGVVAHEARRVTTQMLTGNDGEASVRHHPSCRSTAPSQQSLVAADYLRKPYPRYPRFATCFTVPPRHPTDCGYRRKAQSVKSLPDSPMASSCFRRSPGSASNHACSLPGAGSTCPNSTMSVGARSDR